MASHNAVVFHDGDRNQLTAVETPKGVAVQIHGHSYLLDSDEVQDLIQFLVDASDAAFDAVDDGSA